MGEKMEIDWEKNGKKKLAQKFKYIAIMIFLERIDFTLNLILL